MKLSKKIVSLAAATALVAGAGALTAAPAATAAGKATQGGKTIIDLKSSVAKALTSAGITITPTKPATFAKGIIGFPVTAFDLENAGTVDHSGAITFASKTNPTGVTGENPIFTMTGSNTATITVTALGNPVPLLDVKHVKMGNTTRKIDKSHKKKWVVKYTTVVRGDVHITNNQGVVDLLNSALSTTAFTADMGLGTLKTTLVETVPCSKPSNAGCKKA